MNEAIKLAVEKGGYQVEPLGGDFRNSNQYQLRAMNHEIEWRDKVTLLDPIFWQSLGKALGWNTPNPFGGELDEWKGHWHHFIDALAEGKSPDEFFNQLTGK